VYTSERARIVRAPLGLFLRAFAAPYGAPFGGILPQKQPRAYCSFVKLAVA